jgi:hypothetical protein
MLGSIEIRASKLTRAMRSPNFHATYKKNTDAVRREYDSVAQVSGHLYDLQK